MYDIATCLSVKLLVYQQPHGRWPTSSIKSAGVSALRIFFAIPDGMWHDLRNALLHN